MKGIEKARDFLRSRGQAYRLTFKGEGGKRVLKDLSRFCRAHKSTFHKDPYVMGLMEGRREVWLRVQHHLQLSDEDIWKIYGQGDE